MTTHPNIDQLFQQNIITMLIYKYLALVKNFIKDINRLAKTQGAFFNLITVFLFAIVLGVGISTGNWIFKFIDRQLNISRDVGLPPPDGGQDISVA